jgi:hypothetical protein
MGKEEEIDFLKQAHGYLNRPTIMWVSRDMRCPSQVSAGLQLNKHIGRDQRLDCMQSTLIYNGSMQPLGTLKFG